jgi:uncharacterized membrane protein YgcG
MRRPRLLAALLLAAFFINPTTSAFAQSKTLFWDHYDVILNILANGDLLVVERQEITFTAGTFTYGYAVIPTGRTEGIDSIGVSEPGGRKYSQSSSKQPFTFSVSQTSDEVEIEWYFPATIDGTRRFDLTYIAHGAVRVYDSGDKLQWIAIDSQRDFPIQAASVTVNLPQGTSFLDIDSGGIAAHWQQNAAHDGVTYVSDVAMSPSDTFEIGVEFTHGVVPDRRPSWQAAFDRFGFFDLGLRPWITLGLGLLAVMLLLGGPLLAYVAWFSTGRDPKVGVFPEYLSEPPEPLPPGVLGTLIDERAEMRDIVATLVDLARREYLTIEEVKREVLIFLKSDDFKFRKGQADQTRLRPHEAEILRGIFPGTKSERNLNDLRNKFYTHLPSIQENLYTEMIWRGFFTRSPEKVRQMWRSFGVVILVAAVVLGSVIGPRFPDFAPVLTFVFVGLGTCGLVVAVVGQFMPAKTRKGAEAAARWLAFKKYLERIETLTDLSQAGELFERYLPYAIAFGINTSWIHKFAGLASTPQPIWYVPYLGDGGSSGDRGLQRSLGGPAGGAEGVGGLQGMSDSMAGGLQGMSDGLTRMLNSAGSVMRSAPSSSGSSGGFGGGGFSSGGGGGGGGRGFG